MCYSNSLWALLLVAAPLTPPLCGGEVSQLPVIMANDNRTPAGNLKDGILYLRLELREARWHAEAADGVYQDVYAFTDPPQSSRPSTAGASGHAHSRPAFITFFLLLQKSTACNPIQVIRARLSR